MSTTKDGKIVTGLLLVLVTCVMPYVGSLMIGVDLPQWYGYIMLAVFGYVFGYVAFFAK